MVCSIEGYADKITEVVAGLDPTPTILFGHSMGALIGYSMLSRYPTEIGCIHRFMASAHHPPGSSVSGPDDGPEPDEQYVAYLRRLGGFDERLLSDPAVLEVILPAVRNDLVAVSRFWNKDKAKVQVPIVAITGMEDPTTDSDTVTGWAELTSSEFHLVQVPGGHFYFSNEPERLTSVIMYTLMKAGGSQTT
ncbi:hypothetical protein DNH61_11295 [Paenibacillus sambharensis]|uniref:Thioesterase domain-containing protein n=1 Tax=Paenibacillus sambharensis TaxID=1803190 RepID=A0A2W1LMA4_9BACL|nr:alpha/beta fold hydrolase [Paenibacillus sambharensis]PZD96005.1 hypothetical protein DNH61_11295 [Paenibacillus sambharensis]